MTYKYDARGQLTGADYSAQDDEDYTYDANGDGDLDDQGDTVRYFTWDANHNLTALVGLVEVEQQQFVWQPVERYVYDPYGKAAVYDGAAWSGSPAAADADGPLYAGYFFDSESGLYDVRHRPYHCTVATFMSRDPVGYSRGFTCLYSYVGGRVTDATDPSGLAPQGQPSIDIMDLPPAPSSRPSSDGEQSTSQPCWERSFNYDTISTPRLAVNVLGLSGGASVSLKKTHIDVKVCDALCCTTAMAGMNVKGKSVDLHVKTEVVADFNASKTWGWSDVFGGELFSIGAAVGVTGRVSAPVDFTAQFLACPPAYTGRISICTQAVDISLNAYGRVYAGAIGYSAGGTIAGGAVVRQNFRMNLDLPSGCISNVNIGCPQLVSYGIGARVYVQKPGADRFTRDYCLTGDCSNLNWGGG